MGAVDVVFDFRRIHGGVLVAALVLVSVSACEDENFSSPAAPSTTDLEVTEIAVTDEQERVDLPSPAEVVEALPRSNGRVIIALKEDGAVRGVSRDGRQVIPIERAERGQARVLQQHPEVEVFRSVRRSYPTMTPFGMVEREITSNFFVAKIPPQEELVVALQEHPNVDYVTADDPTANLDSGENQSWGVDTLKAPTMWSSGYTGDGVEIGMADSGYDYDPTLGSWKQHPDFGTGVFSSMTLTYPGACIDVNERCYYEEPLHGTGVWGTAGARINDTLAIGVAPDARHRIYKMVYTDQSGDTVAPPSAYADAIDGIIADVNAGANVPVAITAVSYGPGHQGVPTIRDAFQRADAQNETLWFATVGNQPGEDVRYPAAFDEVVAVTAVNRSRERFSQTNVGPEVELSAPGVNVLTSWNRAALFNNTGVSTRVGTSYAVGHAAGVAALAAEKYPHWSPSKLRSELQEHAEDIGSSGRDDETGFGLVRADCLLDQIDPC